MFGGLTVSCTALRRRVASIDSTGLGYWLAAAVWYHRARDGGAVGVGEGCWWQGRFCRFGTAFWVGRLRLCNMHIQRSDRIAF